jgi:hypothetical protein
MNERQALGAELARRRDAVRARRLATVLDAMRARRAAADDRQPRRGRLERLIGDLEHDLDAVRERLDPGARQRPSGSR